MSVIDILWGSVRKKLVVTFLVIMTMTLVVGYSAAKYYLDTTVDEANEPVEQELLDLRNEGVVQSAIALKLHLEERASDIHLAAEGIVAAGNLSYLVENEGDEACQRQLDAALESIIEDSQRICIATVIAPYDPGVADGHVISSGSEPDLAGSTVYTYTPESATQVIYAPTDFASILQEIADEIVPTPRYGMLLLDRRISSDENVGGTGAPNLDPAHTPGATDTYHNNLGQSVREQRHLMLVALQPIVSEGTNNLLGVLFLAETLTRDSTIFEDNAEWLPSTFEVDNLAISSDVMIMTSLGGLDDRTLLTDVQRTALSVSTTFVDEMDADATSAWCVLSIPDLTNSHIIHAHAHTVFTSVTFELGEISQSQEDALDSLYQIFFVFAIAASLAGLVGLFVFGGMFSGPILRISNVAKKVSGGDLRELDHPLSRIHRDGSGSGELADVSGAFASMVETSRDVIGAAQQNITTTLVTSETLSSAAQSVSASTEELSSTIVAISKGAYDQTSAITDVSASIAQMQSIIEEVITRIQQNASLTLSIAEETNFLALNAAIEASRAGEHGKGFSVVAENVRRLSEESLQASEQIEKAIVEITEDINKRIGQIVGSVERIATVSEETAASTEEAAASSEELTSIAQEVTELAQNMSDVASEAKVTVERFKV